MRVGVGVAVGFGSGFGSGLGIFLDLTSTARRLLKQTGPPDHSGFRLKRGVHQAQAFRIRVQARATADAALLLSKGRHIGSRQITGASAAAAGAGGLADTVVRACKRGAAGGFSEAATSGGTVPDSCGPGAGHRVRLLQVQVGGSLAPIACYSVLIGCRHRDT